MRKMATVNDVLKIINTIAPFRLAANYDNVGLLVGDSLSNVTKGLVCLDITMDVVNEAKRKDINLIISHHPIIFNPIKSITKQNNPVVYELIKHEISAIAAHTNLDLVNGGVNDVLFDKLELSDKAPLGPTSPVDELSLGRIGVLKSYMLPEDFAIYVKQKLKAKSIKFNAGNRRIKVVAICGGSGGSIMDIVKESKADAYVTGDIKHDVFVRAQNENFTLIDAGHFTTEVSIVGEITKNLNEHFEEDLFMVARTCIEKIQYI